VLAPSGIPAHHRAWLKEALIWAVVAAVLLEFVMNLFTRQTLWQRLDALEQRVQHLERIHEMEDQRTK
jgi:hypothetical protein